MPTDFININESIHKYLYLLILMPIDFIKINKSRHNYLYLFILTL